jgi:hypothetical protein
MASSRRSAMSKSPCTNSRDTSSLTVDQFQSRHRELLARMERQHLSPLSPDRIALAAANRLVREGRCNATPVICTTFDPPQWFPTLSLAAKAIGARPTTLWVRIKRGTRCRGYLFKYDEEYRSRKMGRRIKEVAAVQKENGGIASQRAFEGHFLDSCMTYAREGIAFVEELPLPTSPCGSSGMRRVRGRAAYDFFGYRGKDSKFIGIELKSCADHSPSLKIREDGDHGDGLLYHQLSALEQVARKGGIALLMWCNGGAVGVLSGEQIIVAKQRFDLSIARKARGQSEELGSRSIKWELFKLVDFENVGGSNIMHWLKGNE